MSRHTFYFSLFTLIGMIRQVNYEIHLWLILVVFVYHAEK